MIDTLFLRPSFLHFARAFKKVRQPWINILHFLHKYFSHYFLFIKANPNCLYKFH